MIHYFPPRRSADLVGAAKIGLTLGAESVWAGFQRFGVAEPLYTSFPGEATSVLRHYTQWGQIATASASYGYGWRSEEHTSELQSLMRISYSVFCLSKKISTDLDYKWTRVHI